MPSHREQWNVHNTDSHDYPSKKRRRSREDGDDREKLRQEKKNLTFYPAYCFNASPVWFTWVKLTAYDIHYTLYERKGFQAILDHDNHNSFRDQPLLLFFLNHPVQFVQVIGVVVELDEYNERFWLFTIDDSSGATINVTCRKPDVKSVQNTTAQSTNADPELQELKKQANERLQALRALHDLISTQISIGTVVQAKGTINTFRETRQIVLERLSIIPTTTQEIALVRSRVNYHDNVLSKPWTVTQSEQQKLQKAALGEADETRQRQRRVRERAKWREDREKRHARQIQKQYEVEEEERTLQAEKAKRNGEDLAVSIAEQRQTSLAGKTRGASSVRDITLTYNQQGTSAQNETVEGKEHTQSNINGQNDRMRLLRLLKKS